MNKQSVSASGAIVFWNCGPSSRELIAALYERLGLEKHTPNVRTNEAALQTALLERYAGPTVEIQKHDKARDNGFEVVDVDRGTDQNEYHTRFCVKVGLNEQVETWRGGYGEGHEIQSEFDKQKRMLTAQAVGKSLVDVLGTLAAVSLRQSGGMYWIPEEAIDRWIELGAGIEAAADEPDANKIYWVRTIMDETGIRAVKDAITSEVTSAATELTREIVEGNLGEVALETRKTRAIFLRERVTTYSQILGDALQTLKDVVSVAEQAAASALAVQQSGDVFEGIM